MAPLLTCWAADKACAVILAQEQCTLWRQAVQPSRFAVAFGKCVVFLAGWAHVDWLWAGVGMQPAVEGRYAEPSILAKVIR
jgi:hypothetical protein